MIGGRLMKANQGILLTAAAIKKSIGVELTPDEKRAEEALSKGSDE